MSGVTWSVNTLTSKITATCDGSTTLVIADQDLLTYLGFHENISIATSGSQEGTGVVDLNGLDCIYVESSIGPQNCISSSGQANNIIATIPINVSFGFSQLFSSVHSGEDSSINYYTHSRDLSTVNIRLLDKNMNELELNGSKSSFMFRVWYQHQSI
tara:strand:- start:279 stop:749 length:471 start_codon:yes stop_codon:yes gene_type:complete